MNRPVEVLLVEDNPADARLTRDTLLEGPVPKRITVVKDGVEAVDYVRRRGAFEGAPRPDIVLLDLNLPKRDGMHVLREIKTDPALRTITVIVLTTSDHFRDVNTAYDALANCYVVKPRELDQFYTVMRGIEEFWMEMAALPTLDPLSSKGERENPKLPLPQKKSGSASARLSHRKQLRRFYAAVVAARPAKIEGQLKHRW
jgi:chemotaxis family two-component system response regulator Rcp1